MSTSSEKNSSLFGFVDADTLCCRCLSPSQSGFRCGRSAADVVFGYRWLCAKAECQCVFVEFHVARTTHVIKRLPRLRYNDRHAANLVLFLIYLEAAFRDLRSRLPTRPKADASLPLDVEWADIDFISSSRWYIDVLRQHA